MGETLKLICALLLVFIGLFKLPAGLAGGDPIDLIIGASCLAVGFFIFPKSGKSKEDPENGPQPKDFTYQAENIAIDVPTERVWLRDISGKSVAIDKSAIVRWSTSTHTGKEGFFVTRNDCPALRIDVRDLDRPQYVIAFSKFKTGNITNVFARNELERDDWFSRLTTFINNS